MDDLIQDLGSVAHNGVAPEILFDCGPDPAQYNSKRKVFNRRFHLRPTAIVFCESAEQVSNVILVAKKYNKEIRVRSGGHDHEGECSATDAIVMDLRKMNNVKIDKEAGTAAIEPGIPFMDLYKILSKAGVSVPHGTCQSVCIAGFTFGGGWGPWTRAKGMACESLIGATIVLGDGTIKKLTPTCADKELLWALRGGGGFSYGIVTELNFKTFDLPEHTRKFVVTWETSPAIEVLKLWEGLIAPDANKNLIGTNLKIMAIPVTDQPVSKSVHECIFYGYYAGTAEEIEADFKVWFKDLPPTSTEILPEVEGANLQFDAWDRVSTPHRVAKLMGTPLVGDIPLETDGPAPHKISSKLVNPEGLGDEGRENLIRSLESDLIFADGELAGVHCYVTLGAISGQFYRNYNPADHPLGSAMPYKDRPYTIQYQVWWNQDAESIIAGKKRHVEMYTNRAMDWIEVARKSPFPQTSGAFISFKDNGIPTETYFMQSYDDLIRIKEKYSEDPDNRFRSRKTII